MEAGRYFKKPKLLSAKIQTLLDEVEAAPVISGVGSGNTVLFEQRIRPYQQYYHLASNYNKFYQNFFGNNNNKSKTKQPQQNQNKGKQKNKNKNKNKNENAKQLKQSKQSKPSKPSNQSGDIPAIGKCKFVVGKILDISDHDNADSMYVEMIDIGEDKPRQICSGIKGKISKEEMIDSLVIVFSNLKKAKLRGKESAGMILAASNEDKSKLEIIRPPKDCQIGERIILEDEDLTQYNFDREIKKKKNNAWDAIKDDLRTDENGIACYKGRKLVTSKGAISVPSLTNSRIS